MKNHWLCAQAIRALLLWTVIPLISLPRTCLGTNTITTNQLGQGVVYRHYHYDSLYNSSQEIFVADVNLNDPAPSLQMPFLTNGATRTVSSHAATVSNAVACVNGQFFNTTTGAIAFLKVKGAMILPTQPGVHDEQGLTDDGKGLTNSIGLALRPSGGWASLATSNVMTAGPDLIRNGVKFTSYDFNDSLVTTRNPRTCLAWTYDNHLLVTVVDGRSSIAAGMTLPELRDYLYTNASVRNAFNLDGGGSSTMWAGGAVKNVPSDGFPRPVADAVAIAAPPPALPLPPASLGGIVSSNVILSWPVSSGAMSYNVKSATVSGGTYVTVLTTETTSGTNVPAAGTTNYYVVTAVNSKGESGNSPQLTVVTVPAVPTGVHATAGRNEVDVSWTAVPGANGYDVRRSTTIGGFYSIVAHVTSTTFTNTGLANGSTYYYVVAATNNTGSSANSSIAAATPLCFPAAPTFGFAATASNGVVVLNWQPNPDAQAYVLNRSSNLRGPYSPVVTGITGTSVTDSNVAPLTVYFYTVSGSNQCGVGTASEVLSAPLLISGISLELTNLVFEGWGGSNGQVFYLESTTNFNPLSGAWTILSTNSFRTNGYFRITNAFDVMNPARFFRVLK